MSATAPAWDVIVVGAGTAGLTAAVFAAGRGARVLLVETAAEVGGTLHWSSAQMSAAGARRQKALGIDDTPDEHFADVMRMSNGNADAALVRLAVDNAADTIDWLEDHGFDFEPTCPKLFYGHQAYGKPRTYWGLREGRSVLAVLLPLLDRHCKAGRIDLRLNSRLTRIVRDGGTVTGIVFADAAGTEHEASARSVALTTGGYSANPALYREIQNRPVYQKAFCPTVKGEGLVAARAAGAKVVNGHLYTLSTLTVLKDENFPSPLSLRVNTIPQQRPPWEIWVNARGERFIAEDAPIIDDREKALERQPGQKMWIVFDNAIRKAAPEIVLTWFDQPMADPFQGHPAFFAADTLPGLAQKAGFDASRIEATVAAYNAAQASEADALGRRHMPMPIAVPPFLAIRQQGGALSTTGGLAVDDGLRVLDADNRPIPGLFAAGEVLGAGQTMGDAAIGGMMVTPALTFGRLLGQRLLPL